MQMMPKVRTVGKTLANTKLNSLRDKSLCLNHAVCLHDTRVF